MFTCSVLFVMMAAPQEEDEWDDFTLFEFKAGLMKKTGTQLAADPRRGLVRLLRVREDEIALIGSGSRGPSPPEGDAEKHRKNNRCSPLDLLFLFFLDPHLSTGRRRQPHPLPMV